MRVAEGGGERLGDPPTEPGAEGVRCSLEAVDLGGQDEVTLG